MTQTALVTGASAGIGTAVARRLVAEDFHVVGCARRSERLDTLAANLGSRFTPITCDLRNETDIAAMFTTIRERFGGVDVLINNAGIGRRAPLMTGETAAWREMLELNVLALSICTREAITDMKRRNVAGHIVHISSMAGHRVPDDSGIYCATKYAVRALTEALRRELRADESDIRVSSVSPGFVETEFAQNYHGDDCEAARTAYTRFTVLQPEDVANAVLFVLQSPAHMQVHDLLIRPTHQPN